MALENPSKGSIVEIITVFCVRIKSLKASSGRASHTHTQSDKCSRISTAMHMPLLGIDLSVSKNSNVLIISKI